MTLPCKGLFVKCMVAWAEHLRFERLIRRQRPTLALLCASWSHVGKAEALGLEEPNWTQQVQHHSSCTAAGRDFLRLFLDLPCMHAHTRNSLAHPSQARRRPPRAVCPPPSGGTSSARLPNAASCADTVSLALLSGCLTLLANHWSHSSCSPGRM